MKIEVLMNSIKRVLIIRCGALGDLVYATSVIDALRLEYGEDTTIDFVCTPGSGTIFKKDDRVNKIYPLKHKKIPIIFSRDKKNIIKNSKATPYDLLINFEYGKQFKSLVDNIVAKRKVGALIDNIIITPELKHMVEITKLAFKDVVSSSIYIKSFPKIIGTCSQEIKEKYSLDEKYIIISPSNSHQKKNRLNYRAWIDENWRELIQKLSKDIQIVIVGGKNEDIFFTKLKPYPKGVVDLVAQTSLGDLIGVIKNATALIATDTGTAHIAAAVDTEVFALIGPTPASHTGPYQTPSNKVHIISADLSCSPCYKTEVMKNCTDNICMKQISTQMVLNKINSANIL